jgi:hypothetical protein
MPELYRSLPGGLRRNISRAGSDVSEKFINFVKQGTPQDISNRSRISWFLRLAKDAGEKFGYGK